MINVIKNTDIGADVILMKNEKLYCKDTGIELTVSTTLPQAQIYSVNYLSGQLDKYGHPMNERDTICIETQNMPDSIHKEEKPTVILKKGKVYDETTTYTFGIG